MANSYLVYKVVVRAKVGNAVVGIVETSAIDGDDAIRRVKSTYKLYTDDEYTFKATLLEGKV